MHYTWCESNLDVPESSEDMINRTIDKTVSTPAFARLTVHWAIRSADKNPTDGYYPLITARVFAAFMFEGTIHHLGEVLCSTWNEPVNGSTAMAREGLNDRHKNVRRFLAMDNGGREYQDVQRIVLPLFSFRDSFAHPKVLQKTIEDRLSCELEPMPAIAWETEVSADRVKHDFKQLEDYCLCLTDVASQLLNDTLQSGWDDCRQKFPHLADPKLEAAALKGFLHCPSSSAYQATLS
jgi:hypothetical protein